MFGNRTPLAILISNMSCNVYYYEHILIERHGDEGGEVLGSRSEVLSTDDHRPFIFIVLLCVSVDMIWPGIKITDCPKLTDLSCPISCPCSIFTI